MTIVKWGRSVSLALCFILLISMFPWTIFADTEEKPNGNLPLLESLQFVRQVGDESLSLNEVYSKAEELFQNNDSTDLKKEIRQDLMDLNSCGIRNEAIAAVTLCGGELRYSLEFAGYENEIWTEISRNKNQDITLRICEAGIENVLVFTEDDRVFINGREVIYDIGEVKLRIEDQQGEIALPNKIATSYRKNAFSGISTSQYNKLIETYTNNNIHITDLPEVGENLIESAVATLIYKGVKFAFKRSMPGLAIDFFLIVAKTMIEGDVAFGAGDAYVSFKIERRKCESKSTSYEQFYIHKGSYYSKKNCAGHKYAHNFYEYGFLETL